MPLIDNRLPSAKIISKDGAPPGNTNAAKDHVKLEKIKARMRMRMGVGNKKIGTTRISGAEKGIVSGAIKENYSRFKDRAGGQICGVHYANSYYLFNNNSISSIEPFFRVPIVGNEKAIKRRERLYGDEKL